MSLFRSKRPQPSAASAAGPTGSLRSRLSKTRGALARGLSALLGHREDLDEGLFDDLEDVLLTADVGVEASRAMVDAVRKEARQQNVTGVDGLLDLVRAEIQRILDPCSRPLEIVSDAGPFVVLVVGVNGVGKTTTSARLAHLWKSSGLSVMMAACDTFRAAAIEQLQTWGQRLDIPVIAQHHGADAAAVAHDALSAARARNCDVLLLDTAGRQHTHSDLMEQLRKIRRVLQKLDQGAPQEVLLVLDAGTGQNALSQMDHFRAAIDVTGLCLTKLDGTAKGGVVLAIAKKYGVPLRYIGVGEGMEDLQEFHAAEFIDALLPQDLAITDN